MSLESGGMFRFVVAVDEVVGGVGWVCVMVDILGMLMGHCGLYLPVPVLVLFPRCFLFPFFRKKMEDGVLMVRFLLSSYLHGVLDYYIIANSPNYPDR